MPYSKIAGYFHYPNYKYAIYYYLMTVFNAISDDKEEEVVSSGNAIPHAVLEVCFVLNEVIVANSVETI